jgi:acyl-CoA reductase-like NAD-dependent aldehyde dehydrogenase
LQVLLFFFIKDLFDKYSEELAKLETLNNGTPYSLEKAIISGLSEDWRYNASLIENLDQKVIPSSSNLFSFTKRVSFFI